MEASLTTGHDEPVICECGHQGVVHWRENDQPFSSQWEDYSISGFEGKDFYINGYTTLDDALKRMNPKCPVCGAVGKVKNAKRT
jgi:hypothetical protein